LNPGFSLKSCPTCDQEIPPDKVEEIGGRIAAREHERTLTITREVEKQYADEKQRSDAAAKADLELERQQSAIREARARDEAQQTAEKVFNQKLAEAEQTQAALLANLQRQLAEAASARKTDEEMRARLQAEIDEVRVNRATEIEANAAELVRVKEHAAAELVKVRLTATDEAEARFRDNLKANETAVAEAQAKALEAETRLSALTDQQAATMEASLTAQREILEKDKLEAVNVERSRAFEEKQKLSDKLTELQRAWDKKTAEELGEGAEVNLYDALKKEFPDDDIRRVTKGKEGADILHLVMQSGKKCGTIIYDSKDRNKFEWAYVTKLRADQLAAEAEHAILSTRKFPRDTRQLHLHEGVLLANPARVVILATMIRQHILQLHTQRIGDIERKAKTAALYEFIVSARCSSFLARIDERAHEMLKEQEKEMTWHRNHWNREGEALRAIQKAKADLENQVSRIIGTSADTEAA
jgi:hypothetical protein